MDLSLTLDSRDEATIVKEDGPDGFSAETIFKSATGCQGLTYDDVILLPGEQDKQVLMVQYAKLSQEAIAGIAFVCGIQSAFFLVIPAAETYFVAGENSLIATNAVLPFPFPFPKEA